VLPAFRPQSFARHVEAARRAVSRPLFSSYQTSGAISIGRDLESFLSLGLATRTHAFLSGLGMTIALPRPLRL
jgi:2-phospho-L-lactate guanylyltransferase (CobY/MobA/RfbA family)